MMRGTQLSRTLDVTFDSESRKYKVRCVSAGDSTTVCTLTVTTNQLSPQLEIHFSFISGKVADVISCVESQPAVKFCVSRTFSSGDISSSSGRISGSQAANKIREMTGMLPNDERKFEKGRTRLSVHPILRAIDDCQDCSAW